MEEALEVEEPPPLPLSKTMLEDLLPLAEAGPVEVAPSAGQDVMQRIAEAPARLGTAAYIALEDEFIRVAELEDLRPEDRNLYHSCTRVGLCNRCNWKFGCDHCDEEKAWGSACRLTLWHTADEALRPMRKPRGRPKRRAA